MIESWMVSVFIAVMGVVATYATTRSNVSKLSSDFSQHLENDRDKHIFQNKKLDAQFKRIDELTNRCTVLEQSNKQHLDIQTAENKFVSKVELNLHLKNIEIVSNNTQKLVEKNEGKLESILELLVNLQHQGGDIKCGEQ